MARVLTLLFRRDPSRDCQRGVRTHAGYQITWPDGRSVALGLDSFCRHGQRLLGLDRQLAGSSEKLVQILSFRMDDRDEDMTRLPGHRVRRFFLERKGSSGRLHFLDGTATEWVFEIGRDDPRVLHFLGLFDVADGGRQWLDLAARTLEHGDHTATEHARD